jgi:predicted Fe-S protein YdhL (DUF1289 family)
MITPCKNKCSLESSVLYGKICIVCKRTKKEIKEWSNLTCSQRLKIMEDLDRRRVLDLKTKFKKIRDEL